ncbi:MAG: FG-GAP-like repeat-containing protein [Terriglobia bacterium]
MSQSKGWIPPRGFTRREFLSLGGTASACLIAAPLRGLWLPSGSGARAFPVEAEANLAEYRLTPHYRVQPPLEDILKYTVPGSDAFPTEKYAAELEAVLDRWGAALRQSPPDLRLMIDSLSPQVAASGLTPSELRTIRSDASFEVQRCVFPARLELGRQSLVSQIGTQIGAFVGVSGSSVPGTSASGRLLTTEFWVPSLEVISSTPLVVRTRVRYDWVATAPDADRWHREERLGQWEIEWEETPGSEWRIRKWQALEETRTRAIGSTGPVFVEITEQAFGDNASYREQLRRGTDYWRTVLDAASGIEVYGNVGIACGDIDNDGFDDLYVCQPSGLPNRLYRNRGDGTFEDVTDAAGVGVLDGTPCALFCDINNDGHQDLLVVRDTGPVLFLNQGNGTFKIKPDAFRFANEPKGTFTGAAFGDYDRDGWLDVYFCLYSYYQGLNQYRYPTPYFDAQNGPPNFLFRNNRDGTFADVTAATGLNQNNNRYSFDCHWADYDNDGWPDLYVVNDFGRKNLYRNHGDGTFTDVAEEAGVVDIGPGMSGCWFDYDNDGRLDLYVSDMWEAPGERVSMQDAFSQRLPAEVYALYRHHAKGNSLFRNLGNSRFEDRSAMAGVERSGWSWSNHAWDFDHDGFLDLYIANGMISGPNRRDLESFFWRQVVSQSPLAQQPAPRYEQGWNAINELIRSDGTWAGYQRNVFYLSNHDGTFTSCAGAVGLDFPDDSRAFALADYDHDGRLELFLKNRTEPQLRLLRCDLKEIGNSIAFRLRGTKSNRDAIGAVVSIETELGRQMRLLEAGTGFCSQHSKEVFFGLGKSGALVRAEIRWPSGLVQHFQDLPVNHRIEIEEGSEPFRAEPFRSPRAHSSVEPQGDESPALPEAFETWLLDPAVAPDFELPDLAGAKHTLAEFRGRRVLLNFWALGSQASLKDLPVLERLRGKGTGNGVGAGMGEGVEVVALNVDAPAEAERVRAFVRREKLGLTTLLASEDVAGTYNVLYRYLFDRRRDLGIPTSFLIDEEGRIVKVYQGPLGPLDPEHLQADLRRMPKSAEERVSLALPFSGVYFGEGYHRKNFTFGVAFFQHGYLDQAAASFREAIRVNPALADAYYNLGTIYMSRQMPAEAREVLLRAVEIKPDYADALNNLGLLAAEQKHADEAETYFQKAVEASPQYAIAWQNLGNLYREQHRWKESQQALERALKIDPDDAAVSYSLGLLFALQGDSARAGEYLERAVKLRPNYPEALNNLAILYIRTGRREQAAATLEECIRAAPDYDQSYLNLARLDVALDKRQEARQVLLALLQRHPNQAAAKDALDKLNSGP